jgi:hypothetical protein
VEQPKLRRYLRADHVQGVGLLVPRGGREAHSIAWADGEQQYAIPEWLEELGITDLTEPDEAESDQTGAAESIPPSDPVAEVEATEPVVLPVEEVVTNEPIPETNTPVSETAEPVSDVPSEQPAEPVSEADAIREYLLANGIDTANKKVIADLAAQGVKVTSSQVSRVKSHFEAA